MRGSDVSVLYTHPVSETHASPPPPLSHTPTQPQTHLVKGPVVAGVAKLVGINAKHLVDVNVGALGVDLGIVGPERVGRDTVDFLNPLTGADCQR